MSLDLAELLDLGRTPHRTLFDGCRFPWEALPRIGAFFATLGKPAVLGRVASSAVLEGDVWIGEGAVVEPHAFIRGPTWIGRNGVVRQGAYVRGHVLAGDGCILGHSCEFKNCVLFDEAIVPHFAYVGDSILGHKVHLASGVTLSNVKVTPGNIALTLEGAKLDTGLHKFGAILGDGAEVGCHSVLNPGSVIGRGAVLYPGLVWRGVCPPGVIVKLVQQHGETVRRPAHEP
ncbi:MAG: UDP-N-acetylglucosamine diphosphorylase [Verrucomicrobiae bacterium]|nr:UDP-N-acetylglucosamine diphosphorylase [Verrucomicrobiae bacterium]